MTTVLHGAAAVEHALRRPRRVGQPALTAFLTGGYPDMGRFAELLVEVSAIADVVEIGVPFRDPMADGVSIQRSSHTALDRGASLTRILDTVNGLTLGAPALLMSYVNPLLAVGLERLGDACIDSGIAGFVVPDLPLDEAGPMLETTAPRGLALVQLVTPLTPDERLARLCAASSGFVYAVTVAGTTGAAIDLGSITAYLDRVRAASRLPVCAGFGIRTSADVARLRGHADGVIVGTALIDAIERGDAAGSFLLDLFPTP